MEDDNKSQAQIEEFIQKNSFQYKPKTIKTKNMKRLKKNVLVDKNCAKILLITGKDSNLIRDFILNDLKHSYNLRV